MPKVVMADIIDGSELSQVRFPPLFRFVPRLFVSIDPSKADGDSRGYSLYYPLKSLLSVLKPSGFTFLPLSLRAGQNHPIQYNRGHITAEVITCQGGHGGDMYSSFPRYSNQRLPCPTAQTGRDDVHPTQRPSSTVCGKLHSRSRCISSHPSSQTPKFPSQASEN